MDAGVGTSWNLVILRTWAVFQGIRGHEQVFQMQPFATLVQDTKSSSCLFVCRLYNVGWTHLCSVMFVEICSSSSRHLSEDAHVADCQDD